MSIVKWLGSIVALALSIALLIVVLLDGFPGAVDSITQVIQQRWPDTRLALFLAPTLPAPREVKAAYWLEQNWSTPDRYWFHHASQGTATFHLPYDWFMALEQPRPTLLTSAGLLTADGYLERLGFISSPRSVGGDQSALRAFGYSKPTDAPAAREPKQPYSLPTAPRPANNPDGLPVGFARTANVADPLTGQVADQIGLTCAACHTGHLTYHNVDLRYDGGPAKIDIDKLQTVIGLSVAYTLILPGRFDRFADRVLGPKASAADRAALLNKLSTIKDRLVDQGATEHNLGSAPEGLGRLDALNRIGDQVFYWDLKDQKLKPTPANEQPFTAPVRFPPIWTSPWFSWAQYDASILQPLIRNAGEAMGVAAIVDVRADAGANLYKSSVAVDNLVRIEDMLRGENPFTRDPNSFAGLAAPKWPGALFPDDAAWRIDPQKVRRGRSLYRQMCVECHLGPVADPVFDDQFPDKSFWRSHPVGATGGGSGGWINGDRQDGSATLRLTQMPVAAIDTDPEQSLVLAKRMVTVPASLQIDLIKDLADRWACDGVSANGVEIPFSLALMSIVQKVVDRGLAELNLSDADIKRAWGTRGNCPNLVGQVYKARPLNGVWATAPYLHNGSVPSLYWLLTPAAERPSQFCVGARDFDPEQVGYRVVAAKKADCLAGETEFSTVNSRGQPISGNRISGHSFEGDGTARKAGVIGRGVSESERYDLIEYLKTL